MRCNGTLHTHTSEDGWSTWECSNYVNPGRDGSGRAFRGREEREAEAGGGMRRRRDQWAPKEGTGMLYEGDYRQGMAQEYGARLSIGFAMLRGAR